MPFDAIWTRLSSLWKSGESDASTSEGSSADETDRSATDADETLSYAEQVEYGVDERELPDEDKVLRMLVKRGGRVDENTVLEETGWTQEHLMDVIDDMENDDEVSAVSVGRKRVICRRGFEPKGYRSHLNE
ncbi:helix-turn-helix transcriptional regulator [Halostagnicola kamekurae]|uniref:DUF7343 domain-containing protein n=1 Tax=Halostagnicola kamekurae TaxID=619731 RepID=A0A1I6SF01_9EURY|nr:hypothetical protein [Halostagnicola kamekurae]SFS75499.1 hypothetical protein SAMN04488556_2620 [Halostagnicola kamekurae]